MTKLRTIILVSLVKSRRSEIDVLSEKSFFDQYRFFDFGEFIKLQKSIL